MNEWMSETEPETEKHNVNEREKKAQCASPMHS